MLEGIVGSLDTAGSVLLEQSFMQSLNDVLTSNEGVVSGLINELLELPARAVPTFSKQVADMVDDTQRQTYEYKAPLQSAKNNIISKIPVLSKTLAPKVDTLGRDIKKYGGNNNIFNVFLNPANVNTENISKSAEEIYNIYKDTGDKTIMPRVAPSYINQKGEKVILTSNQKSEFQKISGTTIEKNVEKLLNNSKYKNLSSEEKASVINDIVNYSYAVAKNEVLGIELGDYNTANLYSKIGNLTDYYLLKNQNITADKDSDGKSISGSKKEKTIKYIDSMNMSIPEKAILIKLQNYSFSNYDKEVINYVKNNVSDIKERQQVLETLGFKIRNGKVYSK